MALTINTNVVSINAQRNLSLSGSQLGTAMQRLSSGLRVNSAKDDAAGLAIAERMNAQARGLTVAARNANDGISLAQTAEGALGKVGDMLQRMRELAVQSSNATNSADDRKALQAEVDQLKAEIDRVAKTSEFNGTKLLNGTFAGAVFQVGSSAGDNITVGGIADATVANVGKITYGQIVSQALTAPAAGAQMAAITANLTIQVTGVNTSAISLGEISAASSVTERVGQVVAAINAKTADTGVAAYVDPADSTKFLLQVQPTSAGVVPTVTLGAGFTQAATGLVGGATVVTPASKTTAGISDLTVNTQADSWVAIKQIDKAIDQINSSRANLGALQTRFEKSIENIDIMNENISAARGRIVDADFAAETASLSRTQILQQAGTAMVAQANQLSQGVLSLLQ